MKNIAYPAFDGITHSTLSSFLPSLLKRPAQRLGARADSDDLTMRTINRLRAETT
jgi:hypothetical protein